MFTYKRKKEGELGRMGKRKRGQKGRETIRPEDGHERLETCRKKR